MFRAKALFFLTAIVAAAQVTSIPAAAGGGGGAVSSVTAGATGAITVSPTTGATVVDVDTAYVPSKTGSNTWTGANTFAGASTTAPAKTGTSLPGTCTVGDQYFKSDATAGSNLYGCTSTNTWTLLGGSSGYPSNTTVPTYLWRDLCQVSATGWYNGWQNSGGTFQRSSVASDPPCSTEYTISVSGDPGRLWMGDGADKIVRNNGNWDFTFDAKPTAQNDKTVYFGVNQGTTTTNDGCWIKGDRVDASTTYVLYCRTSAGGDGAATTMTGHTITATRQRFRIRRSGSTVYASIDGGTEFSTTANVPTASNGAAPMIRWDNDVAGASGTLYFYRFGMAY